VRGKQNCTSHCSDSDINYPGLKLAFSLFSAVWTRVGLGRGKGWLWVQVLDEFRRRRPGCWTRGATQWHVQGSTLSLHHGFRVPP
jgi:hypothetical protein